MFSMYRNDEVQQVEQMPEQAVIRLTTANELTMEDCSNSESASDSNDDGEGRVWARSGVQAEDYIKRRII